MEIFTFHDVMRVQAPMGKAKSGISIVLSGIRWDHRPHDQIVGTIAPPSGTSESSPESAIQTFREPGEVQVSFILSNRGRRRYSPELQQKLCGSRRGDSSNTG